MGSIWKGPRRFWKPQIQAQMVHQAAYGLKCPLNLHARCIRPGRLAVVGLSVTGPAPSGLLIIEVIEIVNGGPLCFCGLLFLLASGKLGKDYLSGIQLVAARTLTSSPYMQHPPKLVARIDLKSPAQNISPQCRSIEQNDRL